jgi:hypothetical protein
MLLYSVYIYIHICFKKYMHIYIQVYYEGMRAAGYLSLSIYIL